MNTSLLVALRVVERADTDPLRAALFANVMRRSLAIRAACGAYQRLAPIPWAASVLVGGYALRCYLAYAPPPIAGPLLAVAAHPNEAHQLDELAGWVAPRQVVRIIIGARPLGSLLALAGVVRRFRTVRRAFALLRRTMAGKGFLVACRLASALGCYLRATGHIERCRPAATVVASDYNPESAALSWAARSAGVPTIFVSHSHTHRMSPRLRFDLSILEGPAALSRYQEKGRVDGRVVFRGVEGTSRPMDPSRLLRSAPVVGVFPPKEIVWQRLRELVEDIRGPLGARKVILRWHPNMLERPRPGPWCGADPGVLSSSSADSLVEVASRCDWVAADPNSSVHLAVLKAGIPTVTIAGLGVFPQEPSDFYGLVADAVIPPPRARLEAKDLAATADFFGESWIARFRRYDAAYMQDLELVRQQLRQAVELLAEPRLRQEGA